MTVSPSSGRAGCCIYLSGVWVFITLCLCLVLPDAKVNNQSETTKCAMESGDGNTGEWLQLFFPKCWNQNVLRVYSFSRFHFWWPKFKCFHRTLFKGHWKTQHLQGQLEGLRHREAGSLAKYCSLSLPQCLNDFETQVIKLGGNHVGCLHNLIPAVWWKNKYMFQVSLWFKLSWFFNSVWIN